jgi:hypothetical protein
MSKTAKQLARARRDEMIKTIADLAQNGDDEKVRLEAAKLLLTYSDGAPGDKNVPDDPDESTPETQAKDAEVLKLIQPPEVE